MATGDRKDSLRSVYQLGKPQTPYARQGLQQGALGLSSVVSLTFGSNFCPASPMTSLRPRSQEHVVSPLGVFSRACFRSFRFLLFFPFLAVFSSCSCSCASCSSCSLVGWCFLFLGGSFCRCAFFLLSAAFSFWSSVVWCCSFGSCWSSASFWRLVLVVLLVCCSLLSRVPLRLSAARGRSSVSFLSFLFGGFLSCLVLRFGLVLVRLVLVLLFRSVVLLVSPWLVVVLLGCCVPLRALFLGLLFGRSLSRVLLRRRLLCVVLLWLGFPCACVLRRVRVSVSVGWFLSLLFPSFSWRFFRLFFKNEDFKKIFRPEKLLPISEKLFQTQARRNVIHK